MYLKQDYEISSWPLLPAVPAWRADVHRGRHLPLPAHGLLQLLRLGLPTSKAAQVEGCQLLLLP